MEKMMNNEKFEIKANNMSKMAQRVLLSLKACIKDNGECTDCMYFDKLKCSEKLMKAAASLIVEQVNFIDFIIRDNAKLEEDWNDLYKKYFDVLQIKEVECRGEK